MNYQDFFKLAKQNNIEKIQITEITDISKSISYIDEEMDNNDESRTISYQIKAEKNNKTVKISTDYLDERIISYLNIKFDYIDSEYEDEYIIDTSNNNDQTIEEITIQDKIDDLKNIYKLKEISKYIKKIQGTYYANSRKIHIINNDGVDISSTSKYYSYYCEVVLDKTGEPISNSKYSMKIDNREINILGLTKSAIKEAEIMLNKKKIDSKKYNIIMRNDIAAALISKIIGAIHADSVRLKLSCLEGNLNKKIFSDKITLIEDPLNKNFPGYNLFDNEGTFTYKKALIEKGVLKTYINSIKEAKLSNVKPTGNYYGNITTSNLYLVPGKATSEELLEKLDNGIYITDYMGAQNTSVDINTGSISIQVFGFVVENGKFVAGLEPCIMTTTFKELLNNVEVIGNDLEFFTKSIGTPSILFKDISIVS